ncbi:hypothetical protein NS283_05725 [Microbacterium testaceum]|nr:hypothetical protein NS283_05725 [Microbacterium testaceum]
MEEFETRTRRQTTLVGLFAREGVSVLYEAMEEDEFMDFLDFLVARAGQVNEELAEAGIEDFHDPLVTLEAILSDGGSEWQVGTRDGFAALEYRVPAGVRDAANAAMSLPGDAGRLLSEAWHATYGRSPQPDLGYRKAIEAVEAVVLPLVMKNDSTATLGKAMGQMRTQGDWKLPFIKEHAQNPSQNVVLGMMQALWSGHSDRHPGTASYVPSTQAAAEAAVTLAVTLVNLFSNGGIARRP